MVAYTQYRSDPRCRREAEALAQRGDEVDFICLGSAGEPKLELIEGVTVRRLAMKRYRGDSAASYALSYATFFLKASLAILRLSLRDRFHVIHVHSMPELMVFIALLPRLLGAKVVLDLHELSPELYADRFGLSSRHPVLQLLIFVERICVRWVHRVICVHEPQAKHIMSRCSPRERPSVVMNVPDPRLFHQSSDAPSGTCDNGTFKMVHHGTIVERYGGDIAVRALASLDGKIPGLEFVIYGDGDFARNLSEEISRLNLGERVSLSGRTLPLEAVAPAIKDAQLGIVPHRDGPIMKWALPTKLMEYVALGIPVVVARTWVVTRYFDDSMVMFFEPGNASDLARCILKLYREPELRRSLAQNAKKFLEEHSWEKEREKLFSVIDGLET
ncbi:MAG: hypothetical protein AMJ46_08515 [Latescibacteria bacterium DG_63]|nr:MAG: hypothetical protein AMJ46_08515 [Latescibacteria bacterium DG_63]